MGLGAAATFTNGMNIISQFGTIGLLPHLWTLWELLVQGKDILVLGSSPDDCSAVRKYTQATYIYRYKTIQTNRLESYLMIVMNVMLILPVVLICVACVYAMVGDSLLSRCHR